MFAYVILYQTHLVHKKDSIKNIEKLQKKDVVQKIGECYIPVNINSLQAFLENLQIFWCFNENLSETINKSQSYSLTLEKHQLTSVGRNQAAELRI